MKEMKCCMLFCLQLVFLLGSFVASSSSINFSRKSFPDGFIFGVGSAAYQYEGAAYIEGKGPSTWDTFTRLHPEKIADGSNGNMAEDFYHRYKEDVKLMKEIGFDSFRFSISWSRVLPRGKISGGVNRLGIKFYNDLINELLANGIKPFVTLFHFDPPQALEDEYLGFLSPKIIDDFRDYADLCFREFGDRVKNWVTLNEPNIFCDYGYSQGAHAPNRCSNYVGNCKSGNSAIEPYVVGHHLLLSHAAAVKLYRLKYQAQQKGTIGITVVSHWFMPINNTLDSQRAASRSLDFLFGWFMDPIVFGDYPRSMRTIVGHRLPKFNKEESEMVKQSFDFIGLNYYTSFYAVSNPSTNAVNKSYTTDSQAALTVVKNGNLIGESTALVWLHLYPKGIRDLLLHIKVKYNNPPIFVTENGMADANNSTLPIEEALKDTQRIKYHYGHLAYLREAIKMGANVHGYYVWTLLDDFEWGSGYTVRFGLTYVDFKNGLKRYKKSSIGWFKRFLGN